MSRGIGPRRLERWCALVPFETACLSVVAMIFLLCRLRKLDEARQRRLLVRQLRCMALANLVYLFSDMLQKMSDLGWLRALPATLDQKSAAACIGVNLVSFVGSGASMLSECHMAIAFAMSVYGAPRALLPLDAGLPFVWLLALPSALVRVLLLHLTWDAEKGCNSNGRTDDFFVVTSAICFALCLACYVASAFGVCRAGMTVQRSVWKRAQLYPLVTCVTLGPLIMYYTTTMPWVDSEAVAFIIGAGLYNANGLLMFFVYALQSKYVLSGGQASKRPTAGAAGAGRHLDFYVNFRKGDSIVEATAEESLATARSNGSPRRVTEANDV